MNLQNQSGSQKTPLTRILILVGLYGLNFLILCVIARLFHGWVPFPPVGQSAFPTGEATCNVAGAIVLLSLFLPSIYNISSSS